MGEGESQDLFHLPGLVNQLPLRVNHPLILLIGTLGFGPMRFFPRLTLVHQRRERILLGAGCGGPEPPCLLALLALVCTDLNAYLSCLDNWLQTRQR